MYKALIGAALYTVVAALGTFVVTYLLPSPMNLLMAVISPLIGVVAVVIGLIHWYDERS